MLPRISGGCGAAELQSQPEGGAMVLELRDVDRMAGRRTKPTYHAASGGFDYAKVVADNDRTRVEPDVIVRTQAQDVGLGVGAAVRPSEWSDMGGLGIRTTWGV